MAAKIPTMQVDVEVETEIEVEDARVCVRVCVRACVRACKQAGKVSTLWPPPQADSYCEACQTQYSIMC